MYYRLLCHNPWKVENGKKCRLDPFGTAQSVWHSGAALSRLSWKLAVRRVFESNYRYYFQMSSNALCSVGLGLGIALTPSVMAIGGYFSDPNQHRLAVGVAATGSSVGVAVFPLLIYYLEDVYAWKGVAILLAAVCAHLLPCGATIQPLMELDGSRPRRWRNILKIFEPVLFRSIAFDVLLLSNLCWSAGASIVIFFLPEYALSTGRNSSIDVTATMCLWTHLIVDFCVL